MALRIEGTAASAIQQTPIIGRPARDRSISAGLGYHHRRARAQLR